MEIGMRRYWAVKILPHVNQSGIVHIIKPRDIVIFLGNITRQYGLDDITKDNFFSETSGAKIRAAIAMKVQPELDKRRAYEEKICAVNAPIRQIHLPNRRFIAMGEAVLKSYDEGFDWDESPAEPTNKDVPVRNKKKLPKKNIPKDKKAAPSLFDEWQAKAFKHYKDERGSKPTDLTMLRFKLHFKMASGKSFGNNGLERLDNATLTSALDQAIQNKETGYYSEEVAQFLTSLGATLPEVIQKRQSPSARAPV